MGFFVGVVTMEVGVLEGEITEGSGFLLDGVFL